MTLSFACALPFVLVTAVEAQPASASAPAAPHAPCATAPEGMTCVAGGSAAVGRDDGPANERPRRDVDVSTFYVDKSLVTNAQYRACVDAKVCLAWKGKVVDDEPAKLDYDRALKFCGWAGKRLPIEWELEKAAAGSSVTSTTEREWTSTWAGESFFAPCTQCSGRDPTGICSSTDPCSRGGAKKVLRVTSTPTLRKADAMSARAAFRCVSPSPTLTGFPTKQGTEKRAVLPMWTAPSEEKRKAAHDVDEDTLDKQECENKGRSFIDCRDPSSYIKTNEPRQSLWVPFIANLGGGYTGVGIDQNYSLLAVQRAEWAWLFDYDPVVVRLHFALRALIMASPDRASFIAKFADDAKDSSLKIIADAYAEHPERAALREVYAVSRKSLAKYYEKQQLGEKDDPSYGWLATEDAYRYVREMHQQGRIVILKGDMLAKKTMQGIAKAARAVGVPIRVYYASNAPEFWPHSQQYKDNVIALPFDDKSVVLQTFSGLRAGFGEPKKGYWHYNVQSGLQQQDLMRRRGVGSLPQLVTVRNKTNDPDLTVSGLTRVDAR